MSTISLTARITGGTIIKVTDLSTWDVPVTGVTMEVTGPGSTSFDYQITGLATGFVDQPVTIANMGQSGSTLSDGIYQILLKEEGDNDEEDTLYWLNVWNLDAALNAKTIEAKALTCSCAEELWCKTSKWLLLRNGIIYDFTLNNMTDVNTDLADLLEQINEEFICGCSS